MSAKKPSKVFRKPLGMIYHPLGMIYHPLGMIYHPLGIVYHPLGIVYHPLGIVLQQFKDYNYSKPSGRDGVWTISKPFLVENSLNSIGTA